MTVVIFLTATDFILGFYTVLKEHFPLQQWPALWREETGQRGGENTGCWKTFPCTAIVEANLSWTWLLPNAEKFLHCFNSLYKSGYCVVKKMTVSRVKSPICSRHLTTLLGHVSQSARSYHSNIISTMLVTMVDTYALWNGSMTVELHAGSRPDPWSWHIRHGVIF